MVGRAGRGTQMGGNKGRAPTCHGWGTLWQLPRRAEGAWRTETREVPQQQRSRCVGVFFMHAGRR